MLQSPDQEPAYQACSSDTGASPVLSASTLASLYDKKPPTIDFTNIKELCNTVDHVSSDVLAVINVSPADFEEICRQERRCFRLRRYHAASGLLIITIPGELHEALHHTLWHTFLNQIFQSGLAASWRSIGSTTFRSHSHPEGDGGEGDSSGGPKPARNYKGAWPTLVIEAGYSESLSALQDDMRWWFSASDHQVKIVLLTKFARTTQTIIIERWEELHTCVGVTTRANANTILRPTLQQRITITRDPIANSYHVHSSALVLEFRLLFLREPGPHEGDLIISTAALQDYARDVWALV
ncbi:hypothetical protein GGR51DRAFT_137340 [Nemania sp. FL0031]|nr:hypothetical protein GGR51DRAFT_137340 [Nemania sp. FL0031]